MRITCVYIHKTILYTRESQGRREKKKERNIPTTLSENLKKEKKKKNEKHAKVNK